MIDYMKYAAAAASAVFLAGCTSSGTAERNALGGAAIGAVAGAAIGNNVGDGDAKKGAVIGAVVGGAAGAVKGCSEAGDCGNNRNDPYKYDTDGDRVVDAQDRYPNDPRRW